MQQLNFGDKVMSKNEILIYNAKSIKVNNNKIYFTTDTIHEFTVKKIIYLFDNKTCLSDKECKNDSKNAEYFVFVNNYISNEITFTNVNINLLRYIAERIEKYLDTIPIEEVDNFHN